jgi:hypothetical protein
MIIQKATNRSFVPSAVSLLNSSGIVPLNSFSRNETRDRLDKEPILGLIEPLKLLLSPTKYVNFSSSYRLSGKDPVKALF